MQFLVTLMLLVSAAAELQQDAAAPGRQLEKLVNCGVCMNVPKSTCKWCSGTGGPAPVSSESSISAPSGGNSNLVNCGVCMNVPQSSCQWCSGTGGAAPVITSDAATMFPSLALLAAFALGYA
eukprot:CAMPEP_0114658560 /NCGR_PEP_ID=MMETSP0191-20121206/15987_1 /TAXON_ID=126664 /ORGANISM="Sorites sp." /LENGTH=122 /DNA_ID=CAMNT_0001880939 /DNA_START=133 /DNA_END=501 /DNA_ORIENTATION=+